MKKAIKITGKLIKITLTVFCVSFVYIATNNDHGFMSGLTGVSCGLIIVLVPTYICLRFGNTVISMFKSDE